MKIAVCIPAYHNPASLNAVLFALDHLASGEHEIEYIVGIDTHDIDVRRNILMPNAVLMIREEPLSLGEKSNNMFRHAERADAYCWLADDVLPLNVAWDTAIPMALEQTEVFCWNELSQPGHPTYPVFSKAYMEAAKFKPFPEWFPYWFIDTWMAEVYAMVFGRGVPVLRGLDLGGKRGKTRGLRDLRYWYEFFIATRKERMGECRGIAEYFGRDPHYPYDQFKEWDDNVAQILTHEHLVATDDSIPAERYRRAKARADDWLALNRKAA